MSSDGWWHELPMIVLTACWGMFGVVWVVGAFYNLRCGPAAQERTSLPWAWLIGTAAYWIFGRLIPPSLWQPLTVDAHWLLLVGVAGLVLGTAFTLWSRFALGTMWTMAPVIKDGHALRTSGPYAITRHPIYTGLLTMLAGTACVSGLGVWLAYCALAVVVVEIKLRAEERLLDRRFGDAYQRYRREVPRLMPRPPSATRQDV